jgi:hypothetical protein
MIRDWAQLPAKNPEWEAEARRIIGDGQLPDVFFVSASTSYMVDVEVEGEAAENDYVSTIQPPQTKIVGRFNDLDEAVAFFNTIKPSRGGQIGSILLEDRLEGEVLHHGIKIDRYKQERRFQDGDLRWVRKAIADAEKRYIDNFTSFADELTSGLKEDAPSPALLARTLGMLQAEIESWNEGEEMDSAISNEFGSHYFSPERLEEILTEKLKEAGWEGTLAAYVDYAASVLGWRTIARRYSGLIPFSLAGNTYAYSSDEKGWRMRNPAERKKDADDLMDLSNEIKAVSEAVGRLVSL